MIVEPPSNPPPVAICTEKKTHYGFTCIRIAYRLDVPTWIGEPICIEVDMTGKVTSCVGRSRYRK